MVTKRELEAQMAQHALEGNENAVAGLFLDWLTTSLTEADRERPLPNIAEILGSLRPEERQIAKRLRLDNQGYIYIQNPEEEAKLEEARHTKNPQVYLDWRATWFKEQPHEIDQLTLLN